MTAAACLLTLALTHAAPQTEVRGQIARIDLDKKELTLEGRGAARGEALTFLLTADTQVLFGRQAGALADLSAGRRVRIVSEVRDGKATAVVIHALGARLAAPSPTPSTGKTDANTVAGVLRRVARTDREIVVVGPGAQGAETETTIQVPETTKIVKGDKPAALEDLKEGDPASVQVERRDGKLSARSIQAGPGAGKAVAATKSEWVPRARLALQIVDQILKQLEDR
jgi:Cu/Ag efflux protein CusF